LPERVFFRTRRTNTVTSGAFDCIPLIETEQVRNLDLCQASNPVRFDLTVLDPLLASRDLP
jgi:hypothetical protein